jgi:hypothetical protein
LIRLILFFRAVLPWYGFAFSHPRAMSAITCDHTGARRTIAALPPVILKERPFLPRMKDLNWRSRHLPTPTRPFFNSVANKTLPPFDAWASLA